jgi:hypothetical protein
VTDVNGGHGFHDSSVISVLIHTHMFVSNGFVETSMFITFVKVQCFLDKLLLRGPVEENFLKSKTPYKGNVKLSPFVWIHFCILIPSNCFYKYFSYKKMYVIRATWKYSGNTRAIFLF